MRLVVDFSITRTGTPFLANVSAATSPVGPDPTYETNVALVSGVWYTFRGAYYQHC